MHKSLLAALMTVAALATPATVPASSAAEAPGPQKLICDNTRSDPYTGTYKSVRVPKGASCYLEDAVVLGNLKALHDPVDVLVINTEVQRNIHIKGAQRDVKIGPDGCRFDPPVGNNVKVTRSHNVAICFTFADNNIIVTRNDGRIMLRDNHAGNSIKVNNNLPYDSQEGDGQHPDIDAIRVYDNVAERRISVQRNADRPLKLRGNTPEPVV